jgi:hypothetical protein
MIKCGLSDPLAIMLLFPHQCGTIKRHTCTRIPMFTLPRDNQPSPVSRNTFGALQGMPLDLEGIAIQKRFIHDSILLILKHVKLLADAFGPTAVQHDETRMAEPSKLFGYFKPFNTMVVKVIMHWGNW